MTLPCKSTEIFLEIAKPGDLGTLLSLIQSYYRFDRIPFNRKEMVPGLKLLLSDDTLGRAWLIRHRHRTVGYIIATFGFDLEFGGTQATVTDLFIRARYRGKGLGRIALLNVEEFCRGCGVQAIELQVARTNASALAFYERLGFRAHERVPMSRRINWPKLNPRRA